MMSTPARPSAGGILLRTVPLLAGLALALTLASVPAVADPLGKLDAPGPVCTSYTQPSMCRGTVCLDEEDAATCRDLSLPAFAEA